METNTTNPLVADLAEAAIGIPPVATGALQNEWAEGLAERRSDDPDRRGTGAWKTAERIAVLWALAEDEQPHVRLRVSELLANDGNAHSWETLEPILSKLADDPVPAVRDAIAKTVAAIFGETGGFTRTHVTAEWALSESPAKRMTAAKILCNDFFCLGANTVASHLAADPVPEVRAAVVDMAVTRVKENPRHYRDIIQRLSTDSNQRVRCAARRAAAASPDLFEACANF
jgi:hypothetical protein